MKSVAAVSFSLVASQSQLAPEPGTGVRQKRASDILGAAQRMLAGEPLPSPPLPALGAIHLSSVAESLCAACAGDAHEECRHETFHFVATGTGGPLRGCTVFCSCARCRGGGA